MKQLPKDKPIFTWDCVRGIISFNDAAREIEENIFGMSENERRSNTTNPSDLLNICRRFDKKDQSTCLPENTYIYMASMQRFVQDPYVMQGIANLRDWFKSRGSMIILLFNIVQLPEELTNDVLVIKDPLPDRKELDKIVRGAISDRQAVVPESLDRVIDLVTGIHAFAVDQTVALSFEKDKAIDKYVINQGVCWDNKCSAISQTKGLKVHEGPESFATLGGCANAKKFFSRLKDSPDRPSALMLIDEIEKQMSGATGPVGDSSGTSQDQLGVLLTMMQDNNISGWLEFGPPGAAKTAFAKALSTELEVPLLMCDLGGMKSSMVGSSEQRIRAAMDVFLSVSNGRGMIIGTCNKFVNLPPELRRRFGSGMWFFDLPERDEQELIWPIYLNQFGIKEQPTFNYEGWTGAEIRQCAMTAWRYKMPLDEASRFIVPVCKQAADVIKEMRSQANGKFISASQPGFYKAPTSGGSEEVTGRKVMTE